MLKTLALLSGVALLAGAYLLRPHPAPDEPRYRALTLVDLSNPLPPEQLLDAGIRYVYANEGLPLTTGPNGEPALEDDFRKKWTRTLRLYRGTGIKVLFMGNFHFRMPADSVRSVDYFGRSHNIACFREKAFQHWLRTTIRQLAQLFNQYEAFGGFVFNDGAHVRVDACYNDVCRRQFKEQHGIAPPPFAHHAGTSRVPDDHLLLRWEEFQRESYRIFLRTQREAVRSVSDDLLALTIPADSWFFGRYLDEDVAPSESETGHLARLQRIERTHVREWHLFRAFPLGHLPERDEHGLQSWLVGEHLLAESPKMFHHAGRGGPTCDGRTYMSPEEIKRMARVTMTENARGIAFWAPADELAECPSALEGPATVAPEMKNVAPLLADSQPLPASVGVLYSTTTEIFEQPWQENTLERWQHLHAFEGLTYALTRASVPFSVVMEDALTPEQLAQYEVLLLPAARFLTTSAAQAIEAAVAAGDLNAVVIGPHPALEGATRADADPFVWYRHVQEGERQEQHLNEQWAAYRQQLLPSLQTAVDRPVDVTTERALVKMYRQDDGNLLIAAANWSLEKPAEVVLEGEGMVTDVLSEQPVGALEDTLTLEMAPAGWRVVRVHRR